MLTMHDMLKQYSTSFLSDFQAMIDANGDELRTEQYRSKVTENFKNDLSGCLPKILITKIGHEIDFLQILYVNYTLSGYFKNTFCWGYKCFL